MENKIVSEEELKLLLSEPKEEQETSPHAVRPQKLSMKFLFERIKELQEENRLMTERIQALDQQLHGYESLQREAVALEERPQQSDPLCETRIPRAARHPVPHKRSIWSSLFGSSSSNTK